LSSATGLTKNFAAGQALWNDVQIDQAQTCPADNLQLKQIIVVHYPTLLQIVLLLPVHQEFSQLQQQTAMVVQAVIFLLHGQRLREPILMICTGVIHLAVTQLTGQILLQMLLLLIVLQFRVIIPNIE
jgi:hypothetical protein